MALPALAQDAPLRANVDANGVDLATGNYVVPVVEGQIGSGIGKLTMVRYRGSGATARDNWTGELRKTVSGGTTTVNVNLGLISDKFTLVSGTYVSAKGNSAKLVEGTGGSAGEYFYTSADGVTATYTSALVFNVANSGSAPVTIATSTGYCNSANAVDCALPTSVTSPDQIVTTIAWDSPFHCDYDSELNPTACTVFYRPRDIRNSAGYGIKIKWKAAAYFTGSAPSSNWYLRDGLKFMDLSRVYCDPDADNCNSVAGPTVSYTTPSGGVEEFTDWRGGTWRFTTGSGTYGVRRPGSSSDDISYTITSGKVTSVTRDGATYGYSWSTSSGTLTATVTNPDSTTTSVGSNTSTGQPTTVTNGASNTTTNTYDSSGRLTRTTYPEGNYVNYTYNTDGLLTEVRKVPKSGSSLPDLTTSWTYPTPTSCVTAAQCRTPDSMTDEHGRTTNYTFSSTHGQLTRIQYPAPSGSTRPEENFTYTQFFAKVKDATGALVDAPFGTYMLTGSTTCSSAATCSGNANETVTTYSYGTGTGIDNLQPLSVTKAAGNSSVSATTAYTYDDAGNVLTVDGPLSGTADTTRYRYDSSNRLVGVVEADPDGGGSLKHRATRYTYSSSGMLTTTEVGTVNSQSDSDWASMTVSQTQTTTFDSDDRPTQTTLASGSTTYALRQYGYNSTSKKLECVAQRMTPAHFASPPSSACSLDPSPGSYGEDRITKYRYDSAGRVDRVTTAFGVTAVEANEVTTTFTANGLPQTVTDAEGNKTTYSYDAFDRVNVIYYPSSTKGAGTSNSSDYEGFVYNDYGDLTSWRLRGYASDSTRHIDYGYDNIGQVTYKDMPGSEPDVAYTYDLFGRLTLAIDSGSVYAGYGYDALGRKTAESSALGVMTYGYDAAGRRTRITWPDSYYADYSYLVNGNLSTIADSTSTTLATYAYDDLGRRTGLTLGNGNTTTYGYDAVSRLTSLAHNLDGSTTTNDVTTTFSYNPASQIVGRVGNNDRYAWGGHANVARSYGSNGLSQLTTSGGTSLGYDVRGNLTSSGSDSYSYSAENMLTSATVSSATTTLAYDPLRRLRETVAPNKTLRFQYDGGDLVTEYNTSGTVLRRYIHGLNADEPLVWYEGSGTSTRNYMVADERGSVVALTDNSGALVGSTPGTYDEYGIPNASGRFQYTGQAYLSSVGLYNYKNRVYSPTLGRFLQTDPIGYSAGMNLYNYVGSDPVNFTDPSGLAPSQQCWSYTEPGNTFSTGDPDGPGPEEPGIGLTGGKTHSGCFSVIIADPFNPSGYYGGGGGGGGGGDGGRDPCKAGQKEIWISKGNRMVSICVGGSFDWPKCYNPLPNTGTVVCNRTPTRAEMCEGAKKYASLVSDQNLAISIGGGIAELLKKLPRALGLGLVFYTVAMEIHARSAVAKYCPKGG